MVSSVKVLYVDDEEDLLMFASTFFEDEGLTLETSSNFNEALKLLQDNEYDLLITDAKMPSGSGHRLIKEARESGFKGKTIMVTGNLQAEEDVKDYDLVVLKPVQFEELARKVKSILNL